MKANRVSFIVLRTKTQPPTRNHEPYTIAINWIQVMLFNLMVKPLFDISI